MTPREKQLACSAVEGDKVDTNFFYFLIQHAEEFYLAVSDLAVIYQNVKTCFSTKQG